MALNFSKLEFTSSVNKILKLKERKEFTIKAILIFHLPRSTCPFIPING